MTLTLFLELATVKYKNANKQLIYGFIYDGNSDVYPIYHHLQDNHNQNMHDLLP